MSYCKLKYIINALKYRPMFFIFAQGIKKILWFRQFSNAQIFGVEEKGNQALTYFICIQSVLAS